MVLGVRYSAMVYGEWVWRVERRFELFARRLLRVRGWGWGLVARMVIARRRTGLLDLLMGRRRDSEWYLVIFEKKD